MKIRRIQQLVASLFDYKLSEPEIKRTVERKLAVICLSEIACTSTILIYRKNSMGIAGDEYININEQA